MIALIASMLRLRRFQAAMLAALATLAFAAAVAIPAFIDAVNQSVIATEVGHASSGEQVIEAVRRFAATGPRQRPDTTFATTVPSDMAEPSLSVVYADETDVLVTGKIETAPRLQFRQNVCDHVVLAAGRCPTGTNEVMISASLAASESLGAGDLLSLQAAHVGALAPDGPLISAIDGYAPAVFDIVGVYHPRSATEPYWGQENLFAADAIRGTDSPIFATQGALSAVDHPVELERVDAVLDPRTLTAGNIAAVRQQVKRSTQQASQVSGGASSNIPQLLDDIDNDVSSAHQTVFLIALPLIGLGWAVVFLASAYAVSGRREEIGVVKLRGVRYSRRLWLGTGEAFLSILVAIPLGYLVATLALRAVIGHLLPHRPDYPPIGAGALFYVLVTLAGCIVAILAAAYRTLGTAAPDLLRNVPPRSAKWRTAAVEVIVVVFAAASVEQMITEQSALAGIDLIAPWCAIAAIGVLSARLLVPLLGFVGRRGLRRGRRSLGWGIGALQIARRPGVTRVFVMMVIAFGMVTYAAAATGIARTARTSRAEVSLGGASVVSVAPLSRFTLLEAVRKADPSGRYAMAAATIPQRSGDSPTIVAVDSSRLAAVSAWPPGTISAARAETLLSPAGRAPIIMRGGVLAVDMQIDKATPAQFEPYLEMYVQPLDGGPTAGVIFSQPDPRKPEWDVDAPMCRQAGCRIAGLTLHDTYYFGGDITITLSAPRIIDPVAAPFDAFAAAGAWHSVPVADVNGTAATISSGADGIRIDGSSGSAGFAVQLSPTDNVFPAPVLATGKIGSTTLGALGEDRIGIPMQQVARLPSLPGLPADAVLLDLQDVDRILPVTADNATDPAVWLAADAPYDMVAKLRSAGLTVTGITDVAPAVTYLDDQGPSVGSIFYLLSTIGVVLLALGAVVLAASVDRTRRGSELLALRVQGLPSRGVASASVFAYLGLTVMAVIGGLVAGLVSWRLTGSKVPIFADGHTLDGMSIWPAWTGMVEPLAAAAALLLVVSGAAAWDLRTFVRRAELNSATGR